MILNCTLKKHFLIEKGAGFALFSEEIVENTHTEQNYQMPMLSGKLAAAQLEKKRNLLEI